MYKAVGVNKNPIRFTNGAQNCAYDYKCKENFCNFLLQSIEIKFNKQEWLPTPADILVGI